MKMGKSVQHFKSTLNNCNLVTAIAFKIVALTVMIFPYKSRCQSHCKRICAKIQH